MTKSWSITLRSWPHTHIILDLMLTAIICSADLQSRHPRQHCRMPCAHTHTLHALLMQYSCCCYHDSITITLKGFRFVLACRAIVLCFHTWLNAFPVHDWRAAISVRIDQQKVPDMAQCIDFNFVVHVVVTIGVNEDLKVIVLKNNTAGAICSKNGRQK